MSLRRFALAAALLGTVTFGVAELSADPSVAVRVSLRSIPEGASIVRGIDQAPLGKTPKVLTRAAVPGQRLYYLRLEGYKEARVVVASDRSADVTITLVPVKPVKPSDPKRAMP